MAHTPGPWGIVFHGDVERIRLNGSTVYQVSDVTAPDFPSGQPRYCLDDLRLIAAAPELLDALMSAVSILSGWEATSRLDAGDTETVRLCKRAIAKAEGRTHEE